MDRVGGNEHAKLLGLILQHQRLGQAVELSEEKLQAGWKHFLLLFRCDSTGFRG